VGVFRDAQDVYDCIGKIFEEAIADPEIGPKTKEAGLTIRFNFDDPDSAIFVDFAEGNVFYGDGVPDTDPAIKMGMKADDANRFWLGKLNLVMAMAKGQVRAKGSVPEMLKMLPLAKPLYARYEAILRSTGRDDLIAAAG
jgi:putative sterol carrier protein